MNSQTKEIVKRVFIGWELVGNGLLGSGTFGAVYKAKNSERNDYAAIKIIKVPKNQKKYISEMEKEAAMMFEMRKSGCVVWIEGYRILPVEEEIWLLIQMELMKGSLEEIWAIPGKALSTRESVHIIKELCDSLQKIHDAGIVHRDIKPANILIDELGRYKFGDLGGAKYMDETLNATSGFGTLNYAAPEVIYGKEYNRTVDIYSMGLILYRMLNKGEQLSVEKRVHSDVIPRPVDADERLWNIIRKACAYNRGNRYQSANEMKRDLDAWLNSEITRTKAHDDDATVQAYGDDATVQAYDDDATVKGCDNSTTVKAEYSPQQPATREAASIFKLVGIALVIVLIIYFVGMSGRVNSSSPNSGDAQTSNASEEEDTDTIKAGPVLSVTELTSEDINQMKAFYQEKFDSNSDKVTWRTVHTQSLNGTSADEDNSAIHIDWSDKEYSNLTISDNVTLYVNNGLLNSGNSLESTNSHNDIINMAVLYYEIDYLIEGVNYHLYSAMTLKNLQRQEDGTLTFVQNYFYYPEDITFTAYFVDKADLDARVLKWLEELYPNLSLE